MIAILCILTPFIAAMGRLFHPHRSSAKITSLVATVTTFVFALFVSGSQIDYEWFPSLGLKFSLDGSGVSSIFVICTALVMIPTSIYASMHVSENTDTFLCLLLLVHTGVNGIFLADSLVLFCIFCELTLIPSLLILTGWNRTGKKQSIPTYVMYVIAGSLLLLAGILAILF